MKQFSVLLQDHIDIARAEVLAVSKSENLSAEGHIVVFESNELEIYEKLGLSKSVYQFIFECEESELDEKIDSTDWNSFYEENFRVRVYPISQTKEKQFASKIWDKLDIPQAKMKNTNSSFEFFFVNDKVFCGKFLGEIDTKTMLERRPHLRPAVHPSGMQPRLAKALVNLAQAEGTIVDPFCGAGGILIEAGLQGFKTKGIDIDEDMIRRAKKNLAAFNLESDLIVGDATEFKEEVDYIVTDLPYGLNTKGKDLEQLYTKFLDNLNLKKRAVIVFPDFVDWKKLVTKFKIKGEYKLYVHKSLTRTVTILEP
jgi:tRNA (guanine10-N2)-dimethyltransferase